MLDEFVCGCNWRYQCWMSLFVDVAGDTSVG